MREQAPGANLLPERVAEASPRVYQHGKMTQERVAEACFRSKLPRVCRPLETQG